MANAVPSLRTYRRQVRLSNGAVICMSGVALLGVTQTPAPGLLQHDVHNTGPGQPGDVQPAHPTRIPLTIGSAAFREDAVTLVIMAVFSLAVGWLIAGRFLRPLRAIITTARDISASNLHRRLGVRGRGDEFTELGETLDDLFGRLEGAVERSGEGHRHTRTLKSRSTTRRGNRSAPATDQRE
jgi:methyl-accepting chemotaxis protein